MSHDQEKTGRVLRPLPVKENSPLTGHDASLGNLAALGIDVLQAAQAGAACGQHPTGGAVPIVAPADAVSPAAPKEHRRKNPFAGVFGSEGQPAEPVWERPVPLRTGTKAQPYPIEVLPPLVRDAIQEVEDFVQAPTALIAASALSAVSTAVQGLISVERDDGLRGPASLYFLTLAASGERKTSADKCFTQAIRQWEAEQKEALKPALAEYRALETEWVCVEEGYKQAIKKAAQGMMLDRHAGEELKRHELNRPNAPRVPSVLRSDDTPEALGVALTRWPVASIMSNEAGIIFGSHAMNPDSAMRNLAALNTCWDGEQLKRDRTTTQSIDVEGMRVTMGLMVQPTTLQAFMDKSGGLARGIGFIARFLVAHPDSTQGTRFYKKRQPGAPAQTAFNARVKQLLDIPAQVDAEGKLTTTYLTLSPEAFDVWARFHDEVEEELGIGRDYYNVQDVASKAADNAARLAACLHTFSDRIGVPTISAESMSAGAELMRWHLNEALRFCRLVAIPPSLRKAEMLEHLLVDNAYGGTVLVPTRTVKQTAPAPIRNAGADEAFSVLEDHNRAKLIKQGQRTFYCLNPEVLNEYRR